MTDAGGPIRSVTYGALVWSQFRRNRFAVISLVVVGLLFIVGALAPFLANNRPVLVTVDADRWHPTLVETAKEAALTAAAPACPRPLAACLAVTGVIDDSAWTLLSTHRGQDKFARTGTFSPLIENLAATDIAVFVILAWVLFQVVFRLATVPADHRTRRVVPLPRLVRRLVLWTATAAAIALILFTMNAGARIYDEQTDWKAISDSAAPGDVFRLSPIPYRPNRADFDQRLQNPSWQVRSKEDYLRRERARLSRYDLDETDFKGIMTFKKNQGLNYPGERAWYHWLGTDHMGRDVASQLIHGARISLVVGFVSVTIFILIGTFIGALGGYFGGKVDFWVMRFIEVMMCFPTIFLILAISVIVKERSVFSVMFVIGITGWTGTARLVRGEFFKQRAQEYVSAGRAIGGNPFRIMFLHILPNAMAPVLVGATFGIAGAILTESTLSFLNLGVPDDVASWGRTLSYGIEYAKYAWWLIIFPGLMIFLAVTSYNLAGEGLRDAIDPRMRQ